MGWFQIKWGGLLLKRKIVYLRHFKKTDNFFFVLLPSDVWLKARKRVLTFNCHVPMYTSGFFKQRHIWASFFILFYKYKKKKPKIKYKNWCYDTSTVLNLNNVWLLLTSSMNFFLQSSLFYHLHQHKNNKEQHTQLSIAGLKINF